MSHDELRGANIFVIGSVGAGKNTLAEAFQSTFGLTGIDSGQLFRIVAHGVLQDAAKDRISPDLSKLNQQDRAEQERIAAALFHKTKLIRHCLADAAFQSGKITSITGRFQSDDLYTPEVNTLVTAVSLSGPVRQAVLNWIDDKSKANSGLIVTGHNLREVKTTDYQIVYLNASDGVAADRLQRRNPDSYAKAQDALDEVRRRNQADGIAQTRNILDRTYRPVIVETDGLSAGAVFDQSVQGIRRNLHIKDKIADQQRVRGIKRSDFGWLLNPFTCAARKPIAEISQTLIQENGLAHVNSNDLVIQAETHLCYFAPDELVLGQKSVPIEANERLKHRDAEAATMLGTALADGRNVVNLGLVRQQVERELGKPELAGDASTHKDLRVYLNSPNVAAFGRHGEEATLNGRGRAYIPGTERFGTLQIEEKHSGRRIVMKEVGPEISRIYGREMHYLHTHRDDEYAAFGAYLDGDKFPFAWVSYSPHDRDYKKAMLQHIGIESHNTLEMTRAWNADWSPKNTMSLLFQYSMSELRKEWEERRSRKDVDKSLAAVTTTINPNLGFKASSFLGCNFIPIALRPAKFTYWVEGDGDFKYMTRRGIEKRLASDFGVVSDITRSPHYAENRIYTLPQNELILCFDPKEQERLLKRDIFVIDQEQYDQLGQTKPTLV